MNANGEVPERYTFWTQLFSSADWMVRNLDTRIEAACPIYDPELQKEVRKIFDLQFRDNVKARIINMKNDNAYKVSNPSRKLQSQHDTYKLYTKYNKTGKF